jgi:crotonobetainyl-CoA:carnitine CoA-transferase CaiB-like acyl-CoA transferase
MTTVEVPGVGDITVPAVFPKLSLTPGEVATLGPVLGEANDAIYGEELALTAEQRQKLNQDGVI